MGALAWLGELGHNQDVVRARLEVSALLLSGLFHGLVLGLAAGMVYRQAPLVPAARPSDLRFEIELPIVQAAPVGRRAAPEREKDAPPEPVVVLPGGGELRALPDTAEPGRGGVRFAPQPPLNLADSVDSLSLSRSVQNHLVQDQLQRLRVATERRSMDDRRATPNPMQLSFLVTGTGPLRQRRKVALSLPKRGFDTGSRPQPLGAAVRQMPQSALPSQDASRSLQRPGTERRTLPVGATTTTGARYQRRAWVTTARPAVPKARAAVPAPERGRPLDNQDSDQLVRLAVKSLIHESTAALERGTGFGGEPPGPGTGAFGRKEPTLSSSALGRRRGPRAQGEDPGLVAYKRSLIEAIDWHDAFPDWAAAEGLGGLVTVDFTITATGAARDLRVARPSGIVDYDRNVLRRISKARFPPMPPQLRRRLGVAELRVRINFDSPNPAVGRDGPGPGGHGGR